MTDEARFHLDGSVVKQNCRVWGSEHPHKVEFRNGHSPHVWGSPWGIVGPYFLKSAAGWSQWLAFGTAEC